MSNEITTYRFLAYDNETGSIRLEGSSIIDYLASYTPDYRISGNMITLVGLGNGISMLREHGEYDVTYGKTYLSIFRNSILEDAEENNDWLSKEAVKRYLSVAKEYLGAVGDIGLNEVNVSLGTS